MIEAGGLSRLEKAGLNVARISSVARQKIEGELPPLMEDTRANYLGKVSSAEEDIYVKASASPWTGKHGIHLLIIPDRRDRQNAPGISNLSSEGLGLSLRLAESLSYQVLAQEGISEADFGVNYTRAELKKIEKGILATVPQHLHIHVTGYSPQDFRPVEPREINRSAELKGKTREVLYPLGEEILFEEIIPELRETFPSFNSIFVEIVDERRRKRLKMTQGRESFSHPDLALILQAMDKLAKVKYDELAKCFFEFDETSGQFLTKADSAERYRLLGRETRLQRIKDYLTNHPGLSRGVKLGLVFLAANATDEQVLTHRELDRLAKKEGRELTEDERRRQIKLTADRLWAYKDLAYALVWSTKKEASGKIDWIFGFDLKVFTLHGVHQSSAFTNKIVERDVSHHLTEEQLRRLQEKERTVLRLTAGEIENLKLAI